VAQTPSADLQGKRERRGVTRKVILLALLLVVLALLLYATYYYLQYRRLPIPEIARTAEEEVAPPEYLYSIVGPEGEDALTRPVGVALGLDNRVYVTDTRSDLVRIYESDGTYVDSFGAIADGENAELRSPAHIAIDADGQVYVSDRRLRAVYVFTPSGEYVRKIAPAGEDAGVWSPLGMTFDEEGNVYVTDVGVSADHRVLAFDTEGEEILRFGSTGQAVQLSELPGTFYFPNGIAISDDERLFVGDSNNRRVQVFDLEGSYDYLIRTSGIPRGLAIDEEARLYVVDVLAHTVDVYTLEGERITGFGEAGSGPGQFQYPNDVSLDTEGRIYVSDRENHQVQVWAWPEEQVIIPGAPETPAQWALCLSPLLLIPPIWLLARRRRFVVTKDFVDALAAVGKVDQMHKRRFKWTTSETVWHAFEGHVVQGIDLAELISPEAYSESDVRDLMDRTGVEREMAILLVLSQRAGSLCTENQQMLALGAALGVETFDHERFLEKFGHESRPSSGHGA